MAGYPVLIAIEPNGLRGKPDHLLVTAFAKTTGGLPPIGVLALSGRLLFADTKMAPEIWSGIGDNPRPTRLISGAQKILTEKNLAGYRRAEQATGTPDAAPWSDIRFSRVPAANLPKSYDS